MKGLKPTEVFDIRKFDEYRIVRYFPEYFLDYREVLDRKGYVNLMTKEDWLAGNKPEVHGGSV